MKRTRAERDVPYLVRRRRRARLALLLLPLVLTLGLFGLVGMVFFHRPNCTVGLVNGRFCFSYGGDPQERYECQIHGVNWPGVVERWGVPRRFVTSYGYGDNIPRDRDELLERINKLDWVLVAADFPRITGNLNTWGIVLPAGWAALLTGGLLALLSLKRVVVQQRLDAGRCPRCRYPSPDLGGDRCPICRLRLTEFLVVGHNFAGAWSVCPTLPLRDVPIAKSSRLRRCFVLFLCSILIAAGVTYAGQKANQGFYHYQHTRFSVGMFLGTLSIYWAGDPTERYCAHIDGAEWPPQNTSGRLVGGFMPNMLNFHRFFSEQRPVESSSTPRQPNGWQSDWDPNYTLYLQYFQVSMRRHKVFNFPIVHHETGGGRLLLPLGWVALAAWLPPIIFFLRWRTARRWSRFCCCPDCRINLIGTLPTACPDCGQRITYRAPRRWQRLFSRKQSKYLVSPLQSNIQ